MSLEKITYPLSVKSPNQLPSYQRSLGLYQSHHAQFAWSPSPDLPKSLASPVSLPVIFFSLPLFVGNFSFCPVLQARRMATSPQLWQKHYSQARHCL